MDNQLNDLKNCFIHYFPEGSFMFNTEGDEGSIFYNDNKGFIKQIGTYRIQHEDIYLNIYDILFKNKIIETDKSFYFKNIFNAIQINEAIFKQSDHSQSKLLSNMEFRFINNHFLITGSISVYRKNRLYRTFYFNNPLNELNELMAIHSYYKNNYYVSAINKYIYDMSDDEKNIVSLYLYS